MRFGFSRLVKWRDIRSIRHDGDNIIAVPFFSLFAQSGHGDRAQRCPLLGVKRTSGGGASMSAYDPKRT
jgi:hypothetical protein